ncbi:MAG: hypothetical protein M0Z44_03480, partial [Gammaproteobacteria bacterium]|nr:hypothetical protein [Gammaproteobacteria bacterium]
MMKRLFALAALALSASAMASTATLQGLSWATAKGKPALALTVSGPKNARLSSLHNGRVLRIHLRNTVMGPKVRDLPALATVNGVFAYLTDHGQGIDIDVLLRKAASMKLQSTPTGYL